jgi:hypothetical protein
MKTVIVFCFVTLMSCNLQTYNLFVLEIYIPLIEHDFVEININNVRPIRVTSIDNGPLER